MDIASTQISSDFSTIVIAAYAAVISTFLLGWDAYKWLVSGAKIDITVSPNMKTFGGFEDDNKTYISLKASNVGDRPTTIVNMGGTSRSAQCSLSASSLYNDVSCFNELRRPGRRI